MTFLRPFARAYSNANRTMRCVPLTLIGLTVMPASSRTSVAAERLQLLAIRARASGVPSLVLDPCVEVLGVLAHDDQVDARVADRHPGERSGGSHGAEQVEPLPQRHVHAAEAGPHRRGDRTLDRDAARPDRIERLRGHQLAVLGERRGAGLAFDPRDADVGGVQDEPGGRRDLGADAVAGDDRHSMCHRVGTVPNAERAPRGFGVVGVRCRPVLVHGEERCDERFGDADGRGARWRPRCPAHASVSVQMEDFRFNPGTSC